MDRPIRTVDDGLVAVAEEGNHELFLDELGAELERVFVAATLLGSARGRELKRPSTLTPPPERQRIRPQKNPASGDLSELGTESTLRI